ncbi:MAG TPA: IS1182 family transposase [Atribacterota bacterium]|nr:IS1182 family transposase [Atribacterota bacterium]
MKERKKVVFKEYDKYQLMLPSDLEDLIPEHHIVKVLNEIIERMDIEFLKEKYPGGGRSSYHPEMMLKVLLYGYTQQIYSSRKLAKALRENVPFMWLSRNNRPDFRTLNRFRSSIMGLEELEEIFTELLDLLQEEGYIKLENYFVDGTKIEGNANKYTFVWKKSTKKYKAMLREKVKALLIKIEEENVKENDEYGDKDLEELGGEEGISSEKIKSKVEEIEKRLKDKRDDKKLKKALKVLKDDYLPRMEKYENQEKLCGDRNSYSKTDPDATFMRMKEDHMKNGQLKAGYNVQIGTENQFIVNYSIHQRAGDTSCFISHCEELKGKVGRLPENIIADAGYGSEENYDYLEKNNIGTYVKYNNFHLEQKKKFKEDRFRVENLYYDSNLDEYICPGLRRLTFIKECKKKTENGYNTTRRIYECKSCAGCSLKACCTKAAGNRKIQISFKLNEYKAKARSNLLSEIGVKLRGKRAIEPETVFGRLKWNWSFKRFLLRGLEKVKIEWGLLSIAHNIVKLATI